MKRTRLAVVTVLAAVLVVIVSTTGSTQNTKSSWPAMQASTAQSAQTSLEKGLAYLRQNQKPNGCWELHEGEGIKPSDKNYGGIGYDDESRADLSNLHHVLEALKETSLPKESPLWDKAIQFIQRTQNRKASNDQSWSGDDGGFIYMPGMSF